MNEFTMSLEKSRDGQHYLVLWYHEGDRKEFVVCSNYNESKHIGSRWDWGHYFSSVVDAVNYWKENRYDSL